LTWLQGGGLAFSSFRDERTLLAEKQGWPLTFGFLVKVFSELLVKALKQCELMSTENSTRPQRECVKCITLVYKTTEKTSVGPAMCNFPTSNPQARRAHHEASCSVLCCKQPFPLICIGFLWNFFFFFLGGGGTKCFFFPWVNGLILSFSICFIFKIDNCSCIFLLTS